MTDGFLHLHDSQDGTPVRIRMGAVEAMYIHVERDVARTFMHGQTVAVKEEEPYTMIVYGNGSMHGVQETIPDVELQMADYYELAGMEMAAGCE